MASGTIKRPKASNMYIGSYQTVTGIDLSLSEGMHRTTVSVSVPTITGYDFVGWIIGSSGTYRWCGVKLDGDNFFYHINSSISGQGSVAVFPIYKEHN